MIQYIRAALTRRGAAAVGACGFDRVRPLLRGGVHPELDWGRTLFCAAFPYYAGEDEGANLSLYARGIDYHHVLGEALEETCGLLRARFPAARVARYADSGVLPEVDAARLSGVAMTGRNGLAILPGWGSYVFLGFLLTDWEPARPLPGADAGFCENCGACEAACPTGALQGGEVDARRCLSALTQKKGTLTPEEEELLRRAPLIWGCDECQRACPHNGAPPLTSIPAFRDKIARLEPGDVAGLTNRTLQEVYPHRAFTWRGAEILRRNLRLNNEGKCHPAETEK